MENLGRNSSLGAYQANTNTQNNPHPCKKCSATTLQASDQIDRVRHLFSCLTFLSPEEFLQRCELYEATVPHQPILINGDLKKTGTEECIMRYGMFVKPTLDKVKKDTFDLLDLGAAQGYFCFQAALDYSPRIRCVAVEHTNDMSPNNADMLRQLIFINKVPGIRHMDSQLSLKFLKSMSDQNRHADVILALLVVDLIASKPEEIPEVIDYLLKLGDIVLLELQSELPEAVENYVRELQTTSTTHDGFFLGKIPRKTHPTPGDTTMGSFYRFEKKASSPREIAGMVSSSSSPQQVPTPVAPQQQVQAPRAQQTSSTINSGIGPFYPVKVSQDVRNDGHKTSSENKGTVRFYVHNPEPASLVLASSSSSQQPETPFAQKQQQLLDLLQQNFQISIAQQKRVVEEQWLVLQQELEGVSPAQIDQASVLLRRQFEALNAQENYLPRKSDLVSSVATSTPQPQSSPAGAQPNTPVLQEQGPLLSELISGLNFFKE